MRTKKIEMFTVNYFWPLILMDPIWMSVIETFTHRIIGGMH